MQFSTTDPSRQLDIPRHNSDTFCKNSTQIGVFKQPHIEGLTGLLQRTKITRLELEVLIPDSLNNVRDKSLEWMSWK